MKQAFAILIVIIVAASFLAGCKQDTSSAATNMQPQFKANPKNKKLTPGYVGTE